MPLKPKIISEEKILEEVKKILEDEYDEEFVIGEGTPVTSRNIYADLFCPSLEILTLVCHDIKLLRSGRLSLPNLNKILLAGQRLLQHNAKEKILVITDFRVYQEFMREIRKAKEENTLDLNELTIKLIEVPVFKKRVDGLDNESFTVGQLITAMKFGLIDYDSLQPEEQQAISVIMYRRGYLDPKPKED